MDRIANYVVGFLFTEDRQQVVLIRKNKPTWQAGKLNGIGGKLEDGELWADCMAREFHEETGVLIPSSAWQHFVTLHNSQFQCRFFHYTSPLARQCRTVEAEEVVHTAVADIPRLPVIGNLRWLIPLALDPGLQFPLQPFTDNLPTGG